MAAIAHLDADDLAYLAEAVPEDVLREASRSLDAGERTWLAVLDGATAATPWPR